MAESIIELIKKHPKKIITIALVLVVALGYSNYQQDKKIIKEKGQKWFYEHML